MPKPARERRRVVAVEPVGPYVLDFYCPAARLAIEVYGSGLSFSPGQEHDSTCEAVLSESGIRVLRFYNREVYQEFDGVLQAIWSALEGCGKAVGR